jgi:hypothetical protein
MDLIDLSLRVWTCPPLKPLSVLGYQKGVSSNPPKAGLQLIYSRQSLRGRTLVSKRFDKQLLLPEL